MFLSPEAYREIAGKMRDAGYDHAFHDEGEHGVVIDMHGIAIALDGEADGNESESR